MKRKGFAYEGYIDYPGVGKIYDKDVYNLVKRHSRVIDRLDPRKMTEMSLLGQCVLMGIFQGIEPNDSTWTFYGENSLLKKKNWG